MHPKRTICAYILAALASLLVAASTPDLYTFTRSAALVATAEVVTIQLPSTATRTFRGKAAAVYCSVACDVDIERDGTLATTTEGTPARLNVLGPAAQAKAYYSSNAGSGTVLGRYAIPAGATQVFDLSDKTIQASQNLTFRTSAITGTAKITVKWEED